MYVTHLQDWQIKSNMTSECISSVEEWKICTKSNFAVQVDPKTGMKYVFKTTDEMTKNQREYDKENSYGVMPESPGKVF